MRYCCMHSRSCSMYSCSCNMCCCSLFVDLLDLIISRGTPDGMFTVRQLLYATLVVMYSFFVLLCLGCVPFGPAVIGAPEIGGSVVVRGSGSVVCGYCLSMCSLHIGDGCGTACVSQPRGIIVWVFQGVASVDLHMRGSVCEGGGSRRHLGDGEASQWFLLRAVSMESLGNGR